MDTSNLIPREHNLVIKDVLFHIILHFFSRANKFQAKTPQTNKIAIRQKSLHGEEGGGVT